MRTLLLLLLISITVYAKSVTATFTYAMGDRDTKIEAKKIAFAEAKRMAIEKIGVWIESETNIVDGQMERDKIRSFVLGYARTRVVSESFDYPKYTVTVEVEIDDEQLKNIPKNEVQPAAPAPIATPEPKQQETVTPAIEEPTQSPAQPEKAAATWYKGLEIGALFGSGALTVTQSPIGAEKEKESYGIGFGGLKIVYLFTKNHAVEFISGGGSTETNDGDTLQVNTSSLAYQYSFDPIEEYALVPYIAFGITSGNATYTESRKNYYEGNTPFSGTQTEVESYQGTGAVLHAGAKWFFRHDNHHLLEAGLLLQSFTENGYFYKNQNNLIYTFYTDIQFERSVLAFGYSYRF